MRSNKGGGSLVNTQKNPVEKTQPGYEGSHEKGVKDSSGEDAIPGTERKGTLEW